MSVTAARGFRAAGVVAGLKASGGRDLAVVVNDGPASAAAGVFTANRVKAAPVLWSQQVLLDGRVRAVVLNAGGANACTGPAGFADTHRTAEALATALSSESALSSGSALSSESALSIGAGEVAVCSTGLIGERLAMPALLGGVDTAVRALSVDGGLDAADAIRTTDTIAKMAQVSVEGWTIGGMAKGAGMLAPGLATMLSVITTDAVMDAAALDTALRAAVRTTFDRLDSDGCMSTNDTVLLLASGASAQVPTPDAFVRALEQVCADLAHQLMADAEGATKEVSITVVNASTEDDAVEVGRAVSRSNLLKCALFGNDPNWGRVLSAVGTTRAAFDSDEIDVAINGVQVCRGGAAGDPREDVDLSARRVEIVIDLHAGSAAATILTNDLSHAYVHENSAYSS